LQILVVDDHALVREGLCQVLKGLDEQIEVLEAPHCARAFELAELHHGLDLVLLDYHLPDMNGLEALAIFGKKHPELPIVMLSGSVNPQIMRQVMAQGAAGFVTKSGKSHELLAILRRVLDGEIYTPTDLLAETGQPPMEDASTGYLPLQFTRRQEEVLYLLLEGRSNKEISEVLNIADETIKTHVTAILRGFGVKSRVQAVLAAARHGYTKSTPVA
jgi:DNA-binding NarL/FixJ family response regulator